ncbi:hypothetical protein RND81_10G003500 [Saponaria officinalis]|uniref:Uncharacterized protein n=1 Tax=Saponaria officinalis TaxID=3572 RepID=A0AAW1HZ51_SAPOF
MAKIPIKFNRVAAAFDEAVKWRPPCDSSSGSEYWPDSGASLSSLVNSFIENGDAFDPFDDMDMNMDMDLNLDVDDDKEDSESEDDDYNETKESLRGFILECTNDNKKRVKHKLMHDIEDALKRHQGRHDFDSSTSTNGLKRNVMSHLRAKGYDAGLCKSRWEKTGRFPAGTYEYIDVNVGKTRYIVELNMVGELDIVRPTTRYKALLDMIPSIMIVDKPQVLKQIIRLMSNAMKNSLKKADMLVAPWRRNGYIQARYFSPYKRTINPESSSLSSANLAKEGVTNNKGSMVGFEAVDLGSTTVPYYYCREHHGLVSKGGVRVGLLGAVLHGT